MENPDTPCKGQKYLKSGVFSSPMVPGGAGKGEEEEEEEGDLT